MNERDSTVLVPALRKLLTELERDRADAQRNADTYPTGTPWHIQWRSEADTFQECHDRLRTLIALHTTE